MSNVQIFGKISEQNALLLKKRGEIRVRLDWTRSNAKQPKFDVIDSSRKVETGHNLSRAVDDVKFWLLRVASRPV